MSKGLALGAHCRQCVVTFSQTFNTSLRDEMMKLYFCNDGAMLPNFHQFNQTLESD